MFHGGDRMIAAAVSDRRSRQAIPLELFGAVVLTADVGALLAHAVSGPPEQ
jgi:hypothetical protein